VDGDVNKNHKMKLTARSYSLNLFLHW